jgi:hypothetical protein
VPDPNGSHDIGGLLPLRPPIDDGEIRLEPPRLEQLTVAQEAEAVELLAALYAATLRRRAERGYMQEAA